MLALYADGQTLLAAADNLEQVWQVTINTHYKEL
jgi:predicted RNase H-like HicB family nuclease